MAILPFQPLCRCRWRRCLAEPHQHSPDRHQWRGQCRVARRCTRSDRTSSFRYLMYADYGLFASHPWPTPPKSSFIGKDSPRRAPANGTLEDDLADREPLPTLSRPSRSFHGTKLAQRGPGNIDVIDVLSLSVHPHNRKVVGSIPTSAMPRSPLPSPPLAQRPAGDAIGSRCWPTALMSRRAASGIIIAVPLARAQCDQKRLTRDPCRLRFLGAHCTG